MNIQSFMFTLHQTLWIKPLECEGRVSALFCCDSGWQYRVRYFYPDDLSAGKP